MKRSNWGSVLALAFLNFIAVPVLASACEEFKELDPATTKEYRDKLIEAEADPLDRLFAFQELVCSDNPVIRAYAIREGLSSSTDALVRHQIMFDSLMQMTRLDVQLTVSSDLSEADKSFIKKHSGLFSLPIKYRSRKDGCMSFESREICRPERSVFISGDRLELGHFGTVGKFELTESNELVGFIRVDSHSDHGRIPSVIRLF